MAENLENRADEQFDDGVQKARLIAEEAEFGSRRLTGPGRFVVPVIAAAWSLFQLSLPQLIILPSTYIRCIHLAFAIILVYFSYPAFRKIRMPRALSFLSAKNRIPALDVILGIVASAVSLYLAIFYEELGFRQGAPNTMDIVVGLTLIVLLLEAARRSLGPFLVVVVTLFIIYSFFGPYMPDVIAFKGVSLSRFISQITISTEGIYGIPLDVSANIVFFSFCSEPCWTKPAAENTSSISRSVFSGDSRAGLPKRPFWPVD